MQGLPPQGKSPILTGSTLPAEGTKGHHALSSLRRLGLMLSSSCARKWPPGQGFPPCQPSSSITPISFSCWLLFLASTLEPGDKIFSIKRTVTVIPSQQHQLLLHQIHHATVPALSFFLLADASFTSAPCVAASATINSNAFLGVIFNCSLSSITRAIARGLRPNQSISGRSVFRMSPKYEKTPCSSTIKHGFFFVIQK